MRSGFHSAAARTPSCFRRITRSIALPLAASIASCVIPLSTTPLDGGMTGGSGESGIDLTGEGGIDVTIPTGAWMNVTGDLMNMPADCGGLTLVWAKPNEDLVIAGVSNVGLYGSVTGGPWSALGDLEDGAATINNRPTWIVSDPASPMTFWESGSYGGCVFKTTDDGQSFVQLGSAGHCDVVSIDFNDPMRQTLVAGAHESPQVLYLSSDGGMTWNNIGAGLPDVFCNEPLVLGPTSYLVGCQFGQMGQVWGTTDSGTTWQMVTSIAGIGPPLVAADQSIYWMGYDGSVAHSPDFASSEDSTGWTTVSPSGTLDPGGRLIQLPAPDGRLAAENGSYVVVSDGQGATLTWTPVTSHVPQTPTETLGGITYSAQRKSIYIWHSTCENSINSSTTVADDAVMAYPFDYETE